MSHRAGNDRAQAAEEITVDALAHGGDGVGRRADGKVIFVPLTAPGDRALVRVTEERRRHSRGELVQLVQPAPTRQTPACGLFGSCGGCQWQHVSYPAQLEAKQRTLARAVPQATKPVIAAPGELGYRRRVRMHWRRVLGFMRAGSREILDVPRCPLLDPLLQPGIDAIRAALRRAGEGNGTAVLLAGSGGALHVSLRGRFARPGGLSRALQETGVFAGGLVQDRGFGDPAVSCGDPDDPLWAPADAFVQVNAEQDARLRQLVWVALPRGVEAALELYAGVGNLTRLVAARAADVLAVEQAPQAVHWLRQNCGHEHVQAVAAVARQEVSRLANAGRRFDLVLLDPPRQGCEPGILQELGRLRPRHVLYVACDPMTLGRDLGILAQQGFTVLQARGLDMMPQTYHVEAVVLLRREEP